jgi:hypothetical protein
VHISDIPHPSVADGNHLFEVHNEKLIAAFVLVWRGSLNGFPTKEVDRRCGGHVNTLTVISRLPVDKSLKRFVFSLKRPNSTAELEFPLRDTTSDVLIVKPNIVELQSASINAFGAMANCSPCLSSGMVGRVSANLRYLLRQPLRNPNSHRANQCNSIAFVGLVIRRHEVYEFRGCHDSYCSQESDVTSRKSKK